MISKVCKTECQKQWDKHIATDDIHNHKKQWDKHIATDDIHNHKITLDNKYSQEISSFYYMINMVYAAIVTLYSVVI